MNQSFAFLLSYVKTNHSCICARVPQSSSLPQSCAEEKSSGVEIGSNGLPKQYIQIIFSNRNINKDLTIAYYYLLLLLNCHKGIIAF